MNLFFLIILACAHCDMTIFEQETTKNATWIKKYDASETKLMAERRAFRKVISEFYERYRYYDLDLVVARENQHFLFGAALASELNLPFAFLESAHLKEGERVLFIDNIIQESGPTKSACEQIEKIGGKLVEVACIIEQDSIREHIPYHLFSLLALN